MPAVRRTCRRTTWRRSSSAAWGRGKAPPPPVAALRLLPPVVRPFNEVAARLMTLGLYRATETVPFPGWKASADRFGVAPQTVETYVERIASRYNPASHTHYSIPSQRRDKGEDEVDQVNPGPVALLGETLLLYQTNGNLSLPLVTLHTTGDEVIPLWHELLYLPKVDLTGRGRFLPIPTSTYRHRNLPRTKSDRVRAGGTTAIAPSPPTGSPAGWRFRSFRSSSHSRSAGVRRSRSRAPRSTSAIPTAIHRPRVKGEIPYSRRPGARRLRPAGTRPASICRGDSRRELDIGKPGRARGPDPRAADPRGLQLVRHRLPPRRPATLRRVTG